MLSVIFPLINWPWPDFCCVFVWGYSGWHFACHILSLSSGMLLGSYSISSNAFCLTSFFFFLPKMNSITEMSRILCATDIRKCLASFWLVGTKLWTKVVCLNCLQTFCWLRKNRFMKPNYNLVEKYSGKKFGLVIFEILLLTQWSNG